VSLSSFRTRSPLATSTSPAKLHWLSVVTTGASESPAIPAPRHTYSSSKKNLLLRAESPSRCSSKAASPYSPFETPPTKNVLPIRRGEPSSSDAPWCMARIAQAAISMLREPVVREARRTSRRQVLSPLPRGGEVGRGSGREGAAEWARSALRGIKAAPSRALEPYISQGEM
jgi:hypothetical protein